MAVFEPLDPADKNRYVATQSYFVTLDCWEELGRYFAKTNVKGIKRRSVADQPETGAGDPIAAKPKKPARVAAKISIHCADCCPAPTCSVRAKAQPRQRRPEGCLRLELFLVPLHPRPLPSFNHFARYAIARLTAGGTGASFPLIARQRISLSSKSSILSYSSKSIFRDRSAP